MAGSSTQLTIDVPDALKDLLAAELAEWGSSGIWESGAPAPQVTRIEAYFQMPFDKDAVVARVAQVFAEAGFTPPEIRLAAVEDRDWLEEWKKSFVSFPIGRRFYVIPSWSTTACPPDRLPIRIDPGQAFGTGTHETTQLMLECLEETTSVARDLQVFDLGTGSGILVIAASLLGFRRLACCDNDPDSVRVALENLERNRVSAAPVFCGSIDTVRQGTVDLLLANLTAEVIVDLFGGIARAVKPGGLAILSGILQEQEERVRAAAAGFGFTIEARKTRAEWLALVARR